MARRPERRACDGLAGGRREAVLRRAERREEGVCPAAWDALGGFSRYDV